MAAQEGARPDEIARKLGLSRLTLAKFISLTVKHGLLQSESGFLRVSDKGERFLREFRKYRRLEKEYQQKRKLVVEFIPGLFKSSLDGRVLS
jgi:Mn-dependent DtxR family transcriptional regulator